MANPVDNLAVPVGKRRVEYAVRTDGKTMLAKTFLETLPVSKQTEFLAKFTHLAQNDENNISSKIFCRERGEIWTFKGKIDKLRVRFPCFRRDNRWILTHGFIKESKSKWREQEFTLADQVRREVIEREERNIKQKSQGSDHHGK